MVDMVGLGFTTHDSSAITEAPLLGFFLTAFFYVFFSKGYSIFNFHDIEVIISERSDVFGAG